MITYKLTAYPDLISRIEDNGRTTTLKRGTVGWQEYQDWIAVGNEVEKCITTEEQAAIDAVAHVAPRQEAYMNAGLTFDYWCEINIEGDTEAIAKYRLDREAIKVTIPKHT